MNEKKFNGMGEIYAQFRPSYPQGFMDYLIADIGVTKDSVIADIGAGTGIFTRQILECGNTVYAVEPNDDMRNIAEKDLQKYNGFITVKGTAENTTLDGESVDFITVAQAFHWFDRATFKAECQRLLRPNGKVILVWNSRDENSEFVKENDEVTREYCVNFKGFSNGMRGGTDQDDFSDFFCGECEIKVFSNPLSFSEQGFIGRNLSSSYALKESDKNYNEYVGKLRELFYKYSQNESVIMPNLTKSFIGKVY